MVTDIATLVILLAFVFVGSRRGAMKMLLSVLGLVVSVLAGMFLYKPVGALLAASGVEESLAARLGENMESVLAVPGIMRDFMAVTGAEERLAQSVAGAAVSVLSFLAVVVLARLVLLVTGAVMGVAGSLPVIRQANGLLGGVIGLAEGIVALFVIFGVVAVIETFGRPGLTASLLGDSHIASFIYNNNPLLGLVVASSQTSLRSR